MNVLTKHFENWLERVTDNLPARLIDVDGEPYLERYFLFKVRNPFNKKQYAAYIHRIENSDSARGVHSHPWYWSLSIVLIGWYFENRLYRTPKDGFIFGLIKPRKIRFANLIFNTTFHRIVKPSRKPVWTLFIRSEETGQGWGFITPIHVGPAGEIIYYEYQQFPFYDKQKRKLKKGYEIKRYRR